MKHDSSKIGLNIKLSQLSYGYRKYVFVDFFFVHVYMGPPICVQCGI